MAKLTDLPIEILNSIFREFLSKDLTDHAHLCGWNLERDAERTRATLYSLSLVSRRLSAIALPILHEQLFESQDIDFIASDRAGTGKDLRYIAFVRYLDVRVATTSEDRPASQPLDSLLRCLEHCIRILHLRLWLHGSSADISSALLQLASLPAMSEVQSLSIHYFSSDGKHTLFRDCSRFRNLAGLHVCLQKGTTNVGSPENPLSCLARLEVDYLDNTEDTTACMALASPTVLKSLELWGSRRVYPSLTTLHDILGSYIWTELEYIWIDSHAWLANGARVVFPTLPPGLRSFTVSEIDTDQLLDSLGMIKDAKWLSKGLETIILDLDDIFEPWEAETYSKEDLLNIAEEAVMACRHASVVLKPDNLLYAIEEMEIYAPSP